MADRLNTEPRPIVVGTIPRLVRPLPFGCVRPRRDRRYPAGAREFVYERDGYRCVRCHTDELLVPQGDDPGSLIVVRGPLTLHHVMPHVMGGCSHPHNLVTLCSSCNTRLGAEGRYLA